MKEKDTLIIGVEHNGKTCRDFSVEPITVRDRLAILDADEEVRSNLERLGALSLSKQLRIEGIPQEKITPDFVLDMYEDDMTEVQEALGRLEKRIAVFREKKTAPADDDPGRQKAGVPG